MDYQLLAEIVNRPEYDGLSYNEILAALTDTTPISTPVTVPAPIEWADISNTLTPSELGSIVGSDIFVNVLSPALASGVAQQEARAKAAVQWLGRRDLIEPTIVARVMNYLVDEGYRTELGVLTTLLLNVGMISAGTATAIGDLIDATEQSEVVTQSDPLWLTEGLERAPTLREIQRVRG